MQRNQHARQLRAVSVEEFERYMLAIRRFVELLPVIDVNAQLLNARVVRRWIGGFVRWWLGERWAGKRSCGGAGGGQFSLSYHQNALKDYISKY